ncbi:MAG: hypothetical protein Q8O90_03840, partial [Elusimicrobiota bacterium]|nr:hypothetical protein [Elusimicrobiota bacterium]
GTAAEIRQVTDGVNSVMETIKEDDATATGNPEKVKAEFDKLWKGKDEANSAVLRVMNLRGADLKIEDWKFNDAVALDTEGKAWAAVSPRMLLLDKKDLSKFTGTEEAPLAANMAAVTKRAKFELSGDLKDLAGGPAEVTTDAAAAVKLIEDLRKDPSINLPAGGSAPVKPPVEVPPLVTPPVVPVVTADETVKREALMRDADDLAAYQVGAKGTMDDLNGKKSSNGAFLSARTNAQGHFSAMSARSPLVAAKAQEIRDAGPKATALQYQQLDALMKEYGDKKKLFEAETDKAYKAINVPKPSGPAPRPHPPVVINNNVSANATAGSSAIVRPTTNNNTINNTTVVKPPQQIPPIVQPRPVTAPKEFSVGMPGGTFMKLTTADSSGASATYSGSYRSGMNWLYKYEVVCVRSGKVFVISRAQRTKALFSTG